MEINENLEIWIASYSIMQGCMDVEQYDKMLMRNIGAAVTKESIPDYMVIGIFTSHDEASDRCDEIRRAQVERHNKRGEKVYYPWAGIKGPMTLDEMKADGVPEEMIQDCLNGIQLTI